MTAVRYSAVIPETRKLPDLCARSRVEGAAKNSSAVAPGPFGGRGSGCSS
ncbi:hypothetical protein [Thermobifida halotolerans]